MSIYSGFGTRQQETHYNKTVEKLIFLMADNIIYTHLDGIPPLTYLYNTKSLKLFELEKFNEEKWF